MPSFKKVALLSHGGTAYVHRLMLGALDYAETNSNIVTRDFRIPSDSAHGTGLAPALNQLRNWQPDGLFCALESNPLEKVIKSLPQPRPAVNLFAARPMPGMTVVAAGILAVFKMAVEHLRQQGFRSLAYLDLEDQPLGEIRCEFFNQIAQPARPASASLIEIVKPALLEDPDAPVTPVPAALAAWLRRLPKPVGVVCTTTGGGGYLIRVCHTLKLRVPEDVGVVGLDDTDLALASDPPLTTVQPAAQQIGRAALELLDRMMNGRPAPPEPVRLDAMDLRIRQSTGLRRTEPCDINGALDYINEHACHGISVKQVLLETQRVSKTTFHSNFLAATGRTPGEAILQRQMEEARRLLAATGVSITTIAETCCFSDSSSFARTFRASHGLSPRDYRRQARGKKPSA